MYKISIRNLFSGIDKWILFSILLLITIGIFGVFSASTRPDEKYDILIKKHLIFCIFGVFILFCISRFSLKNVIITSIAFFIISLILAASTIIFFPEMKGANRWIKLSNFSFQPTEVLKPSFVVLSALLLGRYKSKNDFSFLLNIFLFSVITIILLKQPDFGMFILIFIVWIMQIVSSNLEKNKIIPIIVIFSLVCIFCYFFLDHVQFRINNFFFSNVGDNYQITKSLESFASGGVLGKGLGNGVISKNLPDAHSDFIFALIGEEFGYITSIFIIFLFLVIHLRIYLLIKITNNFFIINSLTGLGNILFFQTIINISSSLNLLPTKGMTLPFISYGGSSLISSSILIGFILALIRSTKNEK
tara:strand:+ start:558 stop:1640 length:1083 start_codon:yes stop_codon:yes gene_type:complete